MNLTKSALLFLILLSSTIVQTQNFPGCPAVDAGADQQICPGECVNLEAIPVGGAETSSYTYDVIPYAPFSYNTGTQVLNNTDDLWTGIVALPFNFCFYGNTYNQFTIGSNGLISFDLTYANGYNEWAIANGIPGNIDAYNSIMAPFHDIDPAVGGEIFYEIVGTAPCRAAVVSWYNVPMYDCNNLIATQQLVIYETTNVIDIYVESKPTCNSWNGAAAIMGIQNADGTQALVIDNYNFPTVWTNTNEAWRISPDGIPNYSVTWQDAAGVEIGTGTTITVCPSQPTEYTVLANYSGCMATVDVMDMVEVTFQGVGALNITGDTSICNGTSTTLTATTGYNTYDWTTPSGNGEIGESITATETGLYVLTVTDNSGCIGTTSVNVNLSPFLTLTESIINVSCTGDSDGSISIAAPGGAAPLTYQWDIGVGNVPTASNLAAGTYNVTVTDNDGCVGEGSYTVDEPTAVGVSIASTTNPACEGDTNGEIIVTPNGGTAPYTYSIDGGANTQPDSTFSGLADGIYTILVNDANNCPVSVNVTLEEPDALLASVTTTDVSCNGNDDGTASISPTGGTIPYTYQWDNGATTSNITGLAAGTILCTVTDANACSVIYTIIINESTLLNLSLSSVDVSCNGLAEGEITLSASGGVPTYEYSIDGGTTLQTANTFMGLTAGTYTVFVTDANSCTATDEITITEPAAITLMTNSIPQTCAGSDGEASVIVSGGVGGYTYEWQPGGATTDIITGLAAGNYTVSVTDANACLETIMVTVDPSPIPTATATSVGVSCNGGADGTATVLANGGTPPYTYLWDANTGNQTTDIASGLTQGDYTAIVTDSLSCTTQVTVTVDEPSPLTLNLSGVNPLCAGDATGSATVSVNGGTPGYTIVWSDAASQITNTAVNLTAGTYTVSVTDANNCFISEAITLTEPAEPLLVSAIGNPADCFGEDNGTINVSSTGGIPPYNYSLDNEYYNGSNIIVGLEAGTYTVYAQDGNGCISTTTSIVDEPQELIVDAGPDITLNYGDSTIIAVVVNAPGNYIYEWSSFSPDMNLSCTDCPNPQAQPTYDLTYNILVTNNNGCTAEDEVRIYIAETQAIFVANAFTPNGDNINDYLFVQGGSAAERVESFRIYDRWGELVFETTDVPLNQQDAGWDGVFRGQEMNGSVFSWYAEIRFIDGEILPYKGDCTLIR